MTLGATRQTIAQRLLADYRTTGILPRISGGDHEGEPNGDTGENQDDQNGDANSGGEQGDGSGDNGFRPITSQAELDNLIGKRLDRERRKLAKELRDEITSEITAEARRKEAEEQGDYKRLLDELQPKYDRLVADVESKDATLETLEAYVKADIAEVSKAVKDAAKDNDVAAVLQDIHPGDDADVAALIAWLNKAKPRMAKLTEKAHTPGNGPNPKPSDGDTKTNIREALKAIRYT